jgi:acetylornithine deacetylase
VVRYTSDALGRAGFDVSIEDLGDGSVCIDARRGNADILVNCHLDTVPDAPGWDADPFTLVQRGGVLTGLGACDVKGSAACVLTAAANTDTPARILFTTDEEAGNSRCVRYWVEKHPGEVSFVVVCEPTGVKGVCAHRGLVSAKVSFQGQSAHSSGSGAASSSATHALVRWSHAVLSDESFSNTHRFNIGSIEGGTKPNMIAAAASARFGMRPSPGAGTDELIEHVRSLAPLGSAVDWEMRFVAPSLAPHQDTARWLDACSIPLADPVDFWTEAALFAHLGVPCIVFGPGDIAQAHAPDEHIGIDQLEQGIQSFARIFSYQSA